MLFDFSTSARLLVEAGSLEDSKKRGKPKCNTHKNGRTKMKNVEIANYTGYRHNRYDGLNSTWGVLMALGGSPTADCFCDDDDDDSEEIWNQIVDGFEEDDEFRQTVLQNLDSDLEAVTDMEIGEECVLCEYCGDYRYNLKFWRDQNGLFVDFDGVETYQISKITGEKK